MVLGVSVGFECLATRIHRGLLGVCVAAKHLLVWREPKMPKILSHCCTEQHRRVGMFIEFFAENEVIL